MDNRTQLERRIGAYAFALWEMTLFLDTHPDNTCALEKFKEFRFERDRLIAEYEEQYGPYVLTSDRVDGECWTWVHGPWPWEYKGGNGCVAV